ncbi:PEP-CTERM sorting domain-containing protein [Duganella sp. PWIR1]
MNIKFALKAVAVAATLIFSGASHAIDYNPAEVGMIFDAANTPLLKPMAPGVQLVEVFTLSGTSAGTDILAFCIEPKVDQQPLTTYTEDKNASLPTWFSNKGLADHSAAVKKLFNSSYASLFTGTTDEMSTKRLGFALALWDVVADDGNIYGGTGQAFSADLDDDIVKAADVMLHAAPTSAQYSYSIYAGTSSAGASQNLISVSAVPEADTWAMLLVGLGMVGFMGRRKSDKSAKFEA